MNKENNELVVYGESGEIISTKFQRLDLNVPATILSYCDDVKNQISAILDSTAQMSIDSDSIVLDEAQIESISSFDQELDESDKQRNKKELPIVKGIKKLLVKAGVEKYQAEERLKTYKGRYEEYCKGIQMVVEAVEAQKQASLNDIALRNSIVQQMEPLLEEIEIMIQVGHQDKAAYDAETEALKQGGEVVGNHTRVKVVKNKVAPPFKEAEFDIMFGEGISKVGDILDLAAENNIVNKSGAWYAYEGNKIGQGRENAKNYLKENPAICEEIETKVITDEKVKTAGEYLLSTKELNTLNRVKELNAGVFLENSNNPLEIKNTVRVSMYLYNNYDDILLDNANKILSAKSSLIKFTYTW